MGLITPSTTQNPTRKPRIYVGDTFDEGMYEHRVADPSGSIQTQNRGLPGTIVSGTAKLWSLQEQKYLEIGGTGVIEVPATIVPKTGETAAHTGAIVKYIVDTDFTQMPGNYSLFLTFTAQDLSVHTVRFRYKVQAKR